MTLVSRPVARDLAEIPGSTGGRLLGMGPAFRRDVLGSLLRGFHEYGDVVRYPFGPPGTPLQVNMVAVNHADGVRQVLAETERTYGKATIGFKVLAEILGRGLLTTEGDVWRRQRRTLAPLFTPRRVAGYAELMTAETERVIADTPVDEPVDLHLLMMRYTLRVVGRALFGDDVDDVLPRLHRLIPLAGQLTVARTMQIARWPLALPTPRNRRIVQVRDEQYAIVDRILARRRTDADRDDLVSRLYGARDPETGAPLSAQEIRDQVLVFLLAGHETTAGALTFTLHLLGRHPEIQEQVVAQLGDQKREAAPDHRSPVAVESAERAALYEGMRLYPTAYLTERITTADVEIAGYRIPKGTLVVVSPWVTHRHPGYWPDPERFDPRRFVGEHDRPKHAYFPFGGGPRSCIGEHFAILEASILLRALLARYRVEALDPAVPVAAYVTLRPSSPVRVRLLPR